MSDEENIVTVEGHPIGRWKCWKHGEVDPGLFIFDQRTELPVAFCRQCWLEQMLNHLRPMEQIPDDYPLMVSKTTEKKE
jgi:hypothetical protein